jgi:hypothetical protein
MRKRSTYIYYIFMKRERERESENNRDYVKCAAPKIVAVLRLRRVWRPALHTKERNVAITSFAEAIPPLRRLITLSYFAKKFNAAC